MTNALNKNSRVVCSKHGIQSPSFICKHLQFGIGLGFNTPEDPPEPDRPFKEAWCDACEKIRDEEGEWNDRSESFAGVMGICCGCFEEIRSRNEK